MLALSFGYQNKVMNILIDSLFFFFLAAPHSIRDPSSLTRDLTCAPCSGRVDS